MSTIIEYVEKKFIVEEMTDEQKAELKQDKPDIYAKLFPEETSEQ